MQHWSFFLGLLEAADFADASSSRVAEISVLFLCDALLLHRGLDTEPALVALAKALDGSMALRAVIFDRICCMALRGVLDGAVGAWLLGKTLEARDHLVIKLSLEAYYRLSHREHQRGKRKRAEEAGTLSLKSSRRGL